MLWQDENGITLNIPARVVDAVAQSGDNLPAVLAHWEIMQDDLDPDSVKECLEGYGAWSADELQNHHANLERLLWVACWDIAEHADWDSLVYCD